MSYFVCVPFSNSFCLFGPACLLVSERKRKRETVEERRGCSLQTPVAVDHYVCVQVSLRVAVGGDNPGDRQRRVCRCACVYYVCVCVLGVTFRYRYNHSL